MDTSSSTYKVNDPLTLTASWFGGCRNLGDFTDRVQCVMSALREALPALHHLYLIGNSKKDSPDLADDLSNLRPWIFKRGWNEYRPQSYSHRLPDGTMSPESKGELGFAVSLGNLQPPVSEIYLRITDRGHGGGFSITLPPSRPELHTVAAARTILQPVLQAWPVRCGYTSSLAWNDLVNPAYADWIDLPIGGITYSSEAALPEALPPATRWERFGSGVLIFISERPDLLDPADVQTALRLRDALAAQGRLALRTSGVGAAGST